MYVTVCSSYADGGGGGMMPGGAQPAAWGWGMPQGSWPMSDVTVRFHVGRSDSELAIEN